MLTSQQSQVSAEFTTKIAYDGRKHYAEAHGMTDKHLAGAGWSTPMIRKGRQALSFPVTTFDPVSRKPITSVQRYRFIDGEKPTYDQDTGYEMQWYGLYRAVAMAEKAGLNYLVDNNGAASTLCGQVHNLPAFSLQSGESSSPTPKLLDELKFIIGDRCVIVAFDCDYPNKYGIQQGKVSAIRRVQLYRENGIEAIAVDMGLPNDGGDLCDFCVLHGADTASQLLQLHQYVIPELESKIVLPKRNNQSVDDDNTYEKAIKALGQLSTSHYEYEAWVEVGMALYAGLGDSGYSLWYDWSSHGPDFPAKNPDEALSKKWKSFKGNPSSGQGKLTIGSLFAWAYQDSGNSWRWLPGWIDYEKAVVGDKFTVPEPEPISEPAPDAPVQPYWRHGLPPMMRGTLVSQGYAQFAPVLELWNTAINDGLLSPSDPVDVQFLKCVSESTDAGFSEAGIRRGLKQGVGQFLSDSVSNIIQDSIESSSMITISETEVERNQQRCEPPKKAGRISEQYTLLPKETMLTHTARLKIIPILDKTFTQEGLVAPIVIEFLTALGLPESEAVAAQTALEEKYSDILKSQDGFQEALNMSRRQMGIFLRTLRGRDFAPLPRGVAYGTTSQYMTVCARALVQAKGGESEYSINELLSFIGCSSRGMNAVLKRAGIEKVKRQFTTRPIKSVEEYTSIPHRWNNDYRGVPYNLFSSAAPAVFKQFGAKGTRSWLEAELTLGHEITLNYHGKNHQILTDMPSSQDKAKDTAAPKRYTWSQMWAMCLIIESLSDKYMALYFAEKADAEERGEVYPPVEEETVEPPKPSKAKREYEEPADTWIRRLLHEATGNVVRYGTVVHQPTGEIVADDYSNRLALGMLMGEALPPIPIEADELVLWLAQERGGVVVDVIENAA